MKNGSNVKRVIELLHDLRRERHVHIERLCDGICTKSMLEKVELGKRKLNPNYLNRLLARLGIDQRGYEKYLYHDDYDQWKKRNDIINAVEDGKLHQAEEMLLKLECRCSEKENLERQFCKFIRAQIMRRQGASEDELFSMYQSALLLTVPNAYKAETEKLILSADEYNLVLECRCRELKYSDVYEILDIYQGLIDYIDKAGYDTYCRAKIYPKTIVYMYNHIAIHLRELDSNHRDFVHIKMLRYCESAIELLKRNNKSYYLTELLELHIKLLEYVCNIGKYQHKKNYQTQLLETKKTLRIYKEICHKNGISPYMQDCCYLYREEDVYCINDVLHKRRKMLGMTMAMLSDNICSARTISRLEKKEGNALGVIVDELFLRLGVSREYVNMSIFTKNKKALDIYEKCRCAVNERNGDLSKTLYLELENILEDDKLNRQILLQLKSLILWSNNEISDTAHIRNIEESIRYTMSCAQRNKQHKIKFLSYPEIQGVHDIGVMLYKKGECIAGMKKIDMLIKYFEAMEGEGLLDVFIGVYEMVMVSRVNMAVNTEQYEYSTKLFSKLNRLSLKLKRTNLLYYNESNMAWDKARGEKNNKI